FPDPETPLNTVKRRLGISRLMFLRLFSRAPRTSMAPQIDDWFCSAVGLRPLLRAKRSSPSSRRLRPLPALLNGLLDERGDLLLVGRGPLRQRPGYWPHIAV